MQAGGNPVIKSCLLPFTVIGRWLPTCRDRVQRPGAVLRATGPQQPAGDVRERLSGAERRRQTGARRRHPLRLRRHAVWTAAGELLSGELWAATIDLYLDLYWPILIYIEYVNNVYAATLTVGLVLRGTILNYIVFIGCWIRWPR